MPTLPAVAPAFNAAVLEDTGTAPERQYRQVVSPQAPAHHSRSSNRSPPGAQARDSILVPRGFLSCRAGQWCPLPQAATVSLSHGLPGSHQ